MKKIILYLVINWLSLNNLFSQEVKFSLDSKTDLWGLSKGSVWLIKPKYTHYKDFDTQGFARVGIGHEYTEYIFWGLIDKYGNEIVEPKYEEIGTFSQNRAVVKEGEYYGYIDNKGNEIIKPKYTVANPFDSKGHAIVAYCEDPKEKDYYKIDLAGKIVTENNMKIYFHKNGSTSAKGKEINGKKTGEWKFYSERGCLVSIENYNAYGVAEGFYKRFFCLRYESVNNPSNNYTSETGNYKNGKRDGLITFYNPNNGKHTYTELWENGILKKVKDIYDSYGNLVSSIGTGVVNFYSEDSRYLSGKMEYQNGHRAGISVWYHPGKTNLQIRQKALYKYDANDVQGLRWEIIEVNDFNGKPLPKGTLKNGNGTWISYDDMDKPTITTTYQNGKKVKEEGDKIVKIPKKENEQQQKEDDTKYSKTKTEVANNNNVNGATTAKTNATLIPFENANSLWGYKNEKGEIVIPAKYSYAGEFSEGLAKVYVNDGGIPSCGYINKTGNIIIPMEWEYATPFEEGIAIVAKGGYFDAKYINYLDGYFGFFDTTGKLLFPLINCYKIEGCGKEFKQTGKVKVYTDKTHFYYINKKGEKIGTY